MGITEGGFHRGDIPTPVDAGPAFDATNIAPRGFPAVRPSFGRVDASALNTQTVEVPFFQPNFSQDRDATPLHPPATLLLPEVRSTDRHTIVINNAHPNPELLGAAEAITDDDLTKYTPKVVADNSLTDRLYFTEQKEAPQLFLKVTPDTTLSAWDDDPVGITEIQNAPRISKIIDSERAQNIARSNGYAGGIDYSAPLTVVTNNNTHTSIAVYPLVEGSPLNPKSSATARIVFGLKQLLIENDFVPNDSDASQILEDKNAGKLHFTDAEWFRYVPPLVEKGTDATITPAKLAVMCLEQQAVGPDLQLAVGAHADYTSNSANKSIKAEFGLEMHDEKNRRALANIGFDVIRNEGTVMITNPAELRPAAKGHDGLREDFRGKLVNGVVDVAQALGVSEVVGVAARNHLEVQLGNTMLEDGGKIMDDVYRDLGFVIGPDGNYHKPLSNNSNK